MELLLSISLVHGHRFGFRLDNLLQGGATSGPLLLPETTYLKEQSAKDNVNIFCILSSRFPGTTFATRLLLNKSKIKSYLTLHSQAFPTPYNFPSIVHFFPKRILLGRKNDHIP